MIDFRKPGNLGMKAKAKTSAKPPIQNSPPQPRTKGKTRNLIMYVDGKRVKT
jgi:hypothetical protein